MSTALQSRLLINFGVSVLKAAGFDCIGCVQEEMESLLGKACKQVVSSLAQMGAVLSGDNSRHVCGVSTTRMLCPDLIHQLDVAVRCLGNIPIILERTLQVGRENEFYFEVSLVRTGSPLLACH